MGGIRKWRGSEEVGERGVEGELGGGGGHLKICHGQSALKD